MLFGQKHAEASAGCVSGNATTVHTSADDKNIMDHSAASIFSELSEDSLAISSRTP
jgi:hypothetical protein